MRTNSRNNFPFLWVLLTWYQSRSSSSLPDPWLMVVPMPIPMIIAWWSALLQRIPAALTSFMVEIIPGSFWFPINLQDPITIHGIVPWLWLSQQRISWDSLMEVFLNHPPLIFFLLCGIAAIALSLLGFWMLFLGILLIVPCV